MISGVSETFPNLARVRGGNSVGFAVTLQNKDQECVRRRRRRTFLGILRMSVGHLVPKLGTQLGMTIEGCVDDQGQPASNRREQASKASNHAVSMIHSNAGAGSKGNRRHR